LGTLLLKNSVVTTLPNCPECFAREKKKLLEQYSGEESEDESGKESVNESVEESEKESVDVYDLIDKIDVTMKFDPMTKHFVCKRCGLYATREQVGDIRERINRRESTREDKQYDYLEWWQKSKKEKQTS